MALLLYKRTTWALSIGLVMAACTCPSFAASSDAAIDVPMLNNEPALENLTDASWFGAAALALDYDFTYHRASGEPTTVHIAESGDALNIAFSVTQRDTLTAAQTTNNSNVIADDYVGVYLWPQGSEGFAYAFFANVHGSRYQTSSENSAYTPEWQAFGSVTTTGYNVAMRIPLAIIRSGGSTSWRAQFVRATVAANALAVWTHSPNAQIANDPTTAGILNNVRATSAASRPQPRAQVYALGEGTTHANGGSTSRVGADLSLPITPTSSLVASLHPDYSNVELDQQTIAPNPFAYQYSEVRPFFTQVAQPFNQNTGCSNCPQLLYTPSIPTFREGYAAEGTQGPFTFAAFDAIGEGRADQGQTLDYQQQNSNRTFTLDIQRDATDTSSGLHDDATSYATSYFWTPQHIGVASLGGIDRGTNVTAPNQGNYTQTGIYYATSTDYVTFDYQTIGSQFDPVDSYIAQTDITGYSAYGSKTISYSPKALIHDINATSNYGEYHNQFGEIDQYDFVGTFNVDFRNLTTIRVAGGAQNVRTVENQMLPFDSNSIELGYKVSTVTPTYIQYASGPYYRGRLDEWTYLTTQPLRKDVDLTLQAEENDYLPQTVTESRATQWLERASIDYQISKDASFDIGFRRIIGPATPDAITPPTFSYANATNLNLTYHLLKGKNEFYFVYGNADSVSTTHALYVKWIRYIGAGKGT